MATKRATITIFRAMVRVCSFVFVLYDGITNKYRGKEVMP